jgi:hypothetical protein
VPPAPGPCREWGDDFDRRLDGERLTLVTIIAISLRPPSSMTVRRPELTDVLGLGALGRRRAAYRARRRRPSVDEARQAGQPRAVAKSLQCHRQVGTGTSLGQQAPAAPRKPMSRAEKLNLPNDTEPTVCGTGE